MAYLGEEFEADKLPQGGGNFDPLPAGWYTAHIVSAEVLPTKEKNGSYIKIRYDITGPSHQGRAVFAKLHIKNASPKAEEIGRQDLGNLMRAIGLARVTDTDQLIGANLEIKLAISKPQEGYEPSNEVKGYKAISGGIPHQPASKPDGGTSQQPASSRAAPPWAKK